MSEKHDRRTNENDRAALGEQVSDLGDRGTGPRRIRAEAIDAALAACPEQFRSWLRSVYSDYVVGTGWDAEEFLERVVRLGFVRAVLVCVDSDDSTAKERRRGEGVFGNGLPNDRITAAVIRHALEVEEPRWREIAVKWLPKYLTGDREELIALLTRALGWPAGADSYHAAVHLAELAPDTAGLTERLIDAACDGWCASYDAHYEIGETGADRAIALLARLESHPRLSDLGAALAAGRCRSPRAGVELYLRWGGDAGELVRRSWDAPVQALPTLLETFHLLPTTTLGLSARLAAITLDSEYDRLQMLDALAAFGFHAEKLLPDIARFFCDSYSKRDDRPDPLQTFLTALPANSVRWTDEDRWVFALCGKPPGDYAWQVYADWLDDRGDPRGEYVRLRQAAASGDYVSAYRRGAWLDAHGGGWEWVYDGIVSFKRSESDQS